ncbi:hypothetical protein GF377_08235 [candidate division GN15 bacterium]|nr:hypothetical protein [candidate division GN15 bacterium]
MSNATSPKRKQPRSNVILSSLLLSILILGGAVSAGAQQTVQQQVDSLFVIASSGEVKYRDMVEPAIEAIAEIGTDAVPILIDKFTTKSARERHTVVNILKKIGSPAVPYLVNALNRPDGLVVQRVCWALGDIKDSAAVDPLIGIAGHDRWQVRDQAVGALGKIGDRRATPTVTAALIDTIGQVRKAAAVSSGRLMAEGAAERLVGMFADEFYGARLSAYHALLSFDTATVMGVLEDSVVSSTDLVANLCCKLLGEYGTDRARDILLQQTKASDPGRRAHAAVALIKADPLDNCDYRRYFVPQETNRLVQLKIESALRDVETTNNEAGRPGQP